MELFLAKVRSFSSAYKFWTNPSKSGFYPPKCRLRPPLRILIEKCGANLREKLLFAFSQRGFYSELANGSFLCWFDEKNVCFSAKIVIPFLTTFPHCTTMLQKNFFCEDKVKNWIFENTYNTYSILKLRYWAIRN